MNLTPKHLLSAIAFLLLSFSAFAQTSTVSGHLLTPAGSPAPNSKLCVNLQNYKPNIPRVLATGVIVSPTGWCVAASAVDGSVMTSLFQNSSISPSSTYWQFDFYLNGIQSSSANYLVTTATFNFDSAAPITTAPVATPPTGDSTYLRLDGGNQPTGSIIPAANGTQSLGSALAKWNATLNNLTVSGTCTGCGTGTVTSVGLSMPVDFTVVGSPITASGTFTVTRANQTANTLLAGPSSGAAAAPAFRALVPADYPVFVASGASHAAGAVPDPGAVAGTTKFLREDATWVAPTGGVTTVYSTSSASTNAAIATTTMATAGASGNTYFFSFYLDQTTLGTACTGSTTVTVQLLWTDPNASAATTLAIGSLSIIGNGTVGAALSTAGANYTPRAKASTVVQFNTIYTLGAGCTTGPSYQVYPVLTQLQ